MRHSLVATLRRQRAIVAAVSAAVFAAAAPVYAQATAQPAKASAPKTTAAPATPAKAPVAAPQATAAAPTKQPPATATKSAPSTATKPATAANRVFVDINHATVKELKNIPGIGDAYANKIIAGRPYANKSQLASKKIIPDNLYETIQGMIIAKK